ncbi:tetratricopeptide repeat protein [Ferruginibacter yonginensis]|uniref:Tetratricopeptide repeat protein n=1 Tax=Ferruginibacter yonginensis TaxID=1310416 RepID=A0ABV8QPL2_9BACT
MKTTCLLFFSIIFNTLSFAQTPKSLVTEGIKLHDNGKYELAIQKYDAAIELDKNYFDAYYEKSYSLYASNKLDDCIVLSEKIIEQFPTNPSLNAVYVQIGNAQDDQGNHKAALKTYQKGLKKFPNYFLLQYNKGITHLALDELDDAYEDFQNALIDNPLHASSYFRITELRKNDNHIAAMLAAIMFLTLEPQTERSKTTFATLQQLMYGNVKRTGDNAVTIYINSSLLSKKKGKNKLDDFSSQELLFAMSSAIEKDTAVGNIAKTVVDKFDLKLQLLISGLDERGKGFFKDRYVPFFKQLKENNYTNVLSHIVYTIANDERNAGWLKVNTSKVAAFYQWLKSYNWPQK